MKKPALFLVSGVLLLGAVACNNVAKTTSEAPNTTDNGTQLTPAAENARESKRDATSQIRRNQLNADIRAREQRNNITGGDTIRADGDLQSEVRSKLEANLPASFLAVKAEDGVVVISGTVPTQAQLNRVAPLAKEIKGVKSVKVNVKVVPAQPKAD